MLAIVLILAIVCTVLRRRALRWFFTFLSVIFWVAFLALLGFAIGYHMGVSGVSLTHILF